MSEPTDKGAPAWMPASVGSAYRRGLAVESDLVSGLAFKKMLDALGRAAELLGSDRVPRSTVDQASGYRHLLVLLALGIDEALRSSDPYNPRISPGSVDAVLKWGMDCPDAAYSGASVRADAQYRVSGLRGTARYVGLQVMSGMTSTANLVLDDSTVADDGTVDVVLSGGTTQPAGLQLSEGTTSLVVRQFFYDWENERPASLQIVRTDANRHPKHAEELSAPGTASQLVALGEFVEASLTFWLDIEDAGRAQGLNIFREPANRTDIGGAAENVTVWGSWELEPKQALLVEVRPPEALYWSVSLGNLFWETIDYENHQSSLNGFQAVVDEDGFFRAVVAHEDPGVANWLDTAGHTRGPAIFRWLCAQDAPVPQTRVVHLDDVREILPRGTRLVDAAQRQATIEARRRGIRKRFSR